MSMLLCLQQGHVPHRPDGIPFDFIRTATSNVIAGCVDICMRCQSLFANDDFAGMTLEDVAAGMSLASSPDQGLDP